MSKLPDNPDNNVRNQFNSRLIALINNESEQRLPDCINGSRRY